MRTLCNFNKDWQFEGGQQVRLPHTAVELPLDYFDDAVYQRRFTYEKQFEYQPQWRDSEVVLCFDAAMADTRVVLNGKLIASHADGYTPFEVNLGPHLQPGVNTLSVSVDGSENPAIPPFGGQIDYLTYAGIYRDAWLRTTAPLYIDQHKIETPDVLEPDKTLSVAVVLANPRALNIEGTIRAELKDEQGGIIAQCTVPVTGTEVFLTLDKLENIALWDIHSPTLYTLCLALSCPHGTDRIETAFGFRDARFTSQGFFLNGRALKLRGLNRHQSFPYQGYALGRAAQERDADILKYELRLNLVRTSHYPQSSWFLRRCDQIGLLVFEEIPGWQHIGGDHWKAASIDNVRRMIRRDWNHPSIILWGVRINESPDDHDFYAETNRVAHELDPSRQSGGVRKDTDSEFLEDVYTMNDFILGEFELGGNRPRTALRPQQECTGLAQEVPYLVTEFNGHMYPTKIYDQEQRQAEHVSRHLDVLNAMYGDPQIAGAIGWCAFDYNTHKDFGSGNRICHHGVMDMFREPKFAASVYASQGDPEEGIVLQAVTVWARGERSIRGVLPLIILTNCDEVELCYADKPAFRFTPARERYPFLPHPPVIVNADDFDEDPLGAWGEPWEGVLINGRIDGKVVASQRFVADPQPTTLQILPDSQRLREGDETRVMIRVLDQAGNKLPHFFEPVSIEISGSARLLGPGSVQLIAGSTGCWIRAEQAGYARLTVTQQRFAAVSCEFSIEGLSVE